jgi:acyl dehydratase
MPINSGQLLEWPFPEQEFVLRPQDAMLYALSVGVGADPLNEGQLRFAHELVGGPQVLPTMALVLGWPGLWFMDPATGISGSAVVNGEQRVRLHASIPLDTPLKARNRVTGVSDKGPDRGALIHLTRELVGAKSGFLVATVASTLFCRNDGGCGSAGTAPARVPSIPERAPDITVDMPTLPQSALLYRLNGDRHSLHADPATARAAGFERPILHGLATLGVSGHALLAVLCGYQPERLATVGARFTAPVYPGDTVSIDIWRDGPSVSFQGYVRSRGVRVLDAGSASLHL